MNVQTMLADFLSFVTPESFHKKRMASVCASLSSLLQNGQCTVTAIGRGIDSPATEKHCIKRADRLLSNTAMQQDVPYFYTALTRSLVQGKQPLILVDWSNADSKKQHFILRASMALEGRALTLSQMITTEANYNCPHYHQAFLTRLKEMLPEKCRPVIVTDAGYKVPWLKQVRAMGWDYIARVRGLVSVQLPGQDDFVSVSKIYKKARKTAQDLGDVKLSKAHEYQTRAVLLGSGWKLRKRDKHLLFKEPWLLVTSLKHCFDFAKKITRLYGCRMQIEEAFRDQKSQTYGLGSNAHRTKNKARLEVLLLLAALANWLHYMLGLAAELAGKHWQFQANTVKHSKRNNNHTLQHGCRSNQYGSSLANASGVSAVGSFSNSSVRYL